MKTTKGNAEEGYEVRSMYFTLSYQEDNYWSKQAKSELTGSQVMYLLRIFKPLKEDKRVCEVYKDKRESEGML